MIIYILRIFVKIINKWMCTAILNISNNWLLHIATHLNILNLCPTQGRVEGWDAMKPRDYRSVSSKGAGRPRLMHHHKGKWNEMDEMSVEKWWNEICGRGKREKPPEKPTQTPIRPPQNPRGVTETRTRDPSSGRRASNRLCHEAALLLTCSPKVFHVCSAKFTTGTGDSECMVCLKKFTLQ